MDINVFNQMILLFGLMAVGYAANKMGAMNAVSNARMSTFIVKVTLPASILASAMKQNIEDPAVVLSVIHVAAVIFVAMPVMSVIFTRIFRLEKSFQLMLNYSNLGFMGLPLIQGLYGEEYVFYVALYMAIFNVHVFTLGVMILQGWPKSPAQLLKNLCTPGVLSALLALCIVFAGIHFPEPVIRITDSMGNVTTPLAMAVIGSQLAELDLGECFGDYRLYIMSVLRLLVYPLVLYFGLCAVFGPTLIVKISAIIMGLPVASNVTMLCSEYGGDVALTAKGTAVSTLLSLVTIPLMLTVIYG